MRAATMQCLESALMSEPQIVQSKSLNFKYNVFEEDLKSVLAQTIAAEGVLDATAFGIVLDDVEEQES
jgi:hypothetical protein